MNNKEKIIHEIKSILQDEIYAEYPSSRFEESAERIYEEIVVPDKKDVLKDWTEQ